MRYRYTAVVDPTRVRNNFEDEVMSAAELAGASEIEFHEDEEERKPSVSFVVDASNEHTALNLGHEVMRSVLGGKLTEGVVSNWRASSGPE